MDDKKIIDDVENTNASEHQIMNQEPENTSHQGNGQEKSAKEQESPTMPANNGASQPPIVDEFEDVEYKPPVQQPTAYAQQQSASTVQYEATATTAKPKREMTTQEIIRWRTICGWGVIVVAVASLAVCLTLYFTNNLPSFLFDTSGSVYTTENLDGIQTSLSESQAVLDNPEASADEQSEAKRHIQIDKQRQTQVKDHIMWRFMTMFGGIPCIALFVTWFVFARKSQKAGLSFATSVIVKRTILFVLGGFFFFNVLPGILANIIDNIMTIIGILVFSFVLIKIASFGGSSSSSAGEASSVGAGSSTTTANVSSSSASSTVGGGGSGFFSKKPNKYEKKEALSQGGKVDVKEVPANLPLKRVEGGIWNGKAIMYAGADGDDHYVCSQDEFDKGKVVIIDQKGNQRNV